MLEKSFYMLGTKELFFEKNEEDNFLVFDPIRLAYFEVSNIGAEILYCITKKMELKQIVKLIVEEYDIDEEECKIAVLHFLNHLPIQDIIYTSLIQCDLHLQLPPFKKVLS